MQKQIIRMVFIFTLLWILITLFYTFTTNQQLTETESSDTRVILNEIRHLTTDENGHNPAQKQLDELAEYMQLQTGSIHKPNIFISIFPYFAFTAVYLILVFTYIYWKIIRPFAKLEKYANQIAKGNLDITLGYEKTNFFGAFTWAFDHMKEEIKYAKEQMKKKPSMKIKQLSQPYPMILRHQFLQSAHTLKGWKQILTHPMNKGHVMYRLLCGNVTK